MWAASSDKARTFSPDGSRSGRFTNADDQKAQSEEDPSDDGSEVATSDISEAPTELDLEDDRDFGLRKIINHAAFVDLRPCHRRGA